MKKRVSIIVPVYNEGSGIRNFLDRQLYPQLLNLLKSYLVELIIVDDGSDDNTISMVKASDSFKKSAKITSRLVSFSKNFGKEIALAAGINYATGDAIIMIDGDGQHPVNLIPVMLEKWASGAKIVTTIRTGNKTKHRFGSLMFYKIMHLLGNNIPEGAMDYRLIDREVANQYKQFTERNRITRGLIDWLGYPQEYIKIKINGRESGRGSYSKKKLRKLAIDSFVSMTVSPLVIIGKLGALITVSSLALGLFILIQQYIMGDPLHLEWSGAVAMCVFIAFLVGLVMISQSISSLYISQIHTEAKNRPLFLIDSSKSFNIEDNSTTKRRKK
ncbi:glycosyltransferase family 2 protein [Candidatus Saccharibacteria bacterium]|nr:glycosyltransferase family 2 protein [Candidatus Saccharibacteria bacterium]